jgi:serine carboxypeptidase-like clade 1
MLGGLLSFAALVHAVAGAVDADEVTSLPGWSGPLPSRHWSGYVDVSANPGATPGRFLHYYLVEAEDVDPATAPLVLWLNGGPGCSSMEGLFSELGPLFIDEADPTSLRRNAHTWARTANVVFLEAPIGVGFSYTTEGDSFGSGVHVNDTATAIDSERFLRRFLTDPSLFPELRSLAFYIAGESYAGIYIPTLADQITRGNDAGATAINLRGLLIGNGCTGGDTPSCGQSRTASTFLESSAGKQLAFLHDHAMISEVAFREVTETCSPLGAAGGGRSTCREELSDPPADVLDQCFQRSEDVFLCPLTNTSAPAFQCCEAIAEAMDNIGTVNIYGLYEECPQPRDPSMIPSARPTWPLWPEADLASSEMLHGLDGCWGSTEDMTVYLNRPEVRAAIHVKTLEEFSMMYSATEGNETLWRGCGMHNVVYDGGESSDLLPLYVRLAERPELRMLIFNGDVDGCVPYYGAEEWVWQVSQQRGWRSNIEWSPWTVDSQVAGYVTQFEDVGFTFATVYGAGHMVPETRPEAASALFNRFISGDDSALLTGLVGEALPTLAIAKQPQSVVVRRGSSFALAVELTGGAEPYAVTWTQDSRPLSATWQQSEYNLDATQGAQLSVEHAAACHEGRYVCTATDRDGTTVRCGAAMVTLVADPDEDPTACVTAACAAAAIDSLPGWSGPLPSRHYSGYVDVSADPGTTPGRFLHYWLVEAEDVDPATAPLVLWLNGGPGCSSMDGFWHEVGPFRVDKVDDTRIYRNPHSWAKIANVLFLEAPVGTGYSYTEETDMPHIGDEATARDSHTFLERFLGPQYFPQFQSHDFHIWGESYAGIYIPTLANQVLLQNKELEDAGLEPSVNLVALGIGNGCSGTESASCGSRPSASSFAETDEGITLRFLKDHALVSTEMYEGVQSACVGVTGASPLDRYEDCFEDIPWDAIAEPAEGCRGPYSNTTEPDNAETCLTKECYHVCPTSDPSNPNTACCSALTSYERGLGLIDIYGIYNHCDEESDDEERRRRGPSSVVTPRQFILSELVRARGGKAHRGRDATALHDLNGCWGLYDATTAYLNRDVTRRAIHVRSNHEEELAYGPGGGGGWGLCGMRGVQYDRGETADLLPLYPSLVAKLRITIFSGDNDACVPYIGSQAWTSELAEANGWTVAQPWHPWTVNTQVAGYVTVYTETTGEDFTFATVYHAGHMVPEDKPAEALALFKRVTFPTEEAGTVWNPSPATPLHIVSATDLEVGTVGPAPFPAQPATELAVSLGAPVSVGVEVEGGYSDEETAPQVYLFEWAKDGLPIAGASTSSLTIPSMAECDAGVFVATVATLDGETVSSQPFRLVAAPALNATRAGVDGGDAGVEALAASALPVAVGLLVGLLIGCVLGRGSCCRKKTDANARGYRTMPTEEE